MLSIFTLLKTTMAPINWVWVNQFSTEINTTIPNVCVESELSYDFLNGISHLCILVLNIALILATIFTLRLVINNANKNVQIKFLLLILIFFIISKTLKLHLPETYNYFYFYVSNKLSIDSLMVLKCTWIIMDRLVILSCLFFALLTLENLLSEKRGPFWVGMFNKVEQLKKVSTARIERFYLAVIAITLNTSLSMPLRECFMVYPIVLGLSEWVLPLMILCASLPTVFVVCPTFGLIKKGAEILGKPKLKPSLPSQGLSTAVPQVKAPVAGPGGGLSATPSAASPSGGVGLSSSPSAPTLAQKVAEKAGDAVVGYELREFYGEYVKPTVSKIISPGPMSAEIRAERGYPPTDEAYPPSWPKDWRTNPDAWRTDLTDSDKPAKGEKVREGKRD